MNIRRLTQAVALTGFTYGFIGLLLYGLFFDERIAVIILGFMSFILITALFYTGLED